MPMPNGTTYLGRVSRAPFPSRGYRYATLELLAESDAGGLAWLGPVTDAVERFPKRGLVHWHDAPAGLQVGSLWQFGVEEHRLAEQQTAPSCSSAGTLSSRSR